MVPAGGLSLWVHLPERRARQLVAAAREEGMLLSPGTQFAASHGLEGYIRLPYKDPPTVVADAMRRLGRAWRAQAEIPADRRIGLPRPVVA